MNTVIVIPSYKTSLSKKEEMSLKQCLNVLGKFDIFICVPESLDLSYYKQFSHRTRIKKFNDTFFKSITSYNLWCQSGALYRSFIEYDYMLIHQLDAYVFKDELAYWCSLNYDYIGAPWFQNKKVNEIYDHFLERHKTKLKISEIYRKSTRKGCLVGNGGLSLRKVKKHFIYSCLLRTFIKKFNKHRMNEDIFWCIYVRELIPFYRVAESFVAEKFAIETLREDLRYGTFDDLPMGCHAWFKTDRTLEFWKKYIPMNKLT